MPRPRETFSDAIPMRVVYGKFVEITIDCYELFVKFGGKQFLGRIVVWVMRLQLKKSCLD